MASPVILPDQPRPADRLSRETTVGLEARGTAEADPTAEAGATEAPEEMEAFQVRVEAPAMRAQQAE